MRRQHKRPRMKEGRQIESKNHNRTFLALVAIVMGCLTALLYNVTPLFNDDLHYSVYTLERYEEFIEMMFSVDSPRLLNLMFPVFLHVIPKWVIDVAAGALWGTTIWMSAKCTGYQANGLTRIAIAVFALTFFLPWDNGMTCIIYSLNYVWPLPLVLGVIIAFFKVDGSKTRLRLAGLAVLGVCTGLTQEGGSLPIVCGIAVWWIINRQSLSRRQKWLTASLTISCVTLIIVSVYSRYMPHNLILCKEYLTLKAIVYLTLTRYYCTIAVTLLLFGMLMSRRLRARLHNARRGELPLLLTAMYASTAVGIYFCFMGTHLSWYPQFFAIISGLKLVNVAMPNPVITNKIADRTIATAIIAMVVMNLATATKFTYNESQTLAKIEKEYLEADSSNRFYDITTQRHLPLMGWNKLSIANVYCNDWLWSVHCRHYLGRHKDKPIPTELRHITAKDVDKVAGDSPLFSYNGLYVMPDDGSRQEMTLIITYKYGVRKKAKFKPVPFTADNGEKWLYATDNISSIRNRWVTVKEINRMTNNDQD